MSTRSSGWLCGAIMNGLTLRHLLRPGDKELFLSMETLLREMAEEAREQAVHYADPPFQVGGAVLARLKNGDIHPYPGANMKPGSHEVEKICAEQLALGAARMERKYGRFDYGIGVVLFGPAKRDDVSNRPAKTLHPCERCRPWLASMPGIGQDFLVTSIATNGGEHIERLTLREILELHAVRYED